MTNSGVRAPSQHLALDTSTYANLRRRHPVVLDWIAAAGKVDISTIVLGELDAGFRLGSRYDENVSTLAEFLREPFVRVRDVTPQVGRHYGEILAALRRAGTPLSVNDIWIAATAIEAGAHLVTFDRDFARIAGLSHSVLT